MCKKLCCGLLLICLTGCLQTKDELTLNADGSGKVRIETRTAAAGANSAAFAAIAAEMGGQGPSVYPPTSAAEAKKFFPGKDFVLTTKQTNAENGDSVTVIEVEFKDINALLASPYGRAHQLAVDLDKDGLSVKGGTGLETAARLAEVKDDTGMMGMMGMMGATSGDLQKRAGEMRAEFRITLPNAVSSSNGTRDGKTADWTVERAKCKDAADFAQQLGAVAEARCAADGLKFTPVTPTRLALQPFAQLTPGASVSKAPALDTNKIAAAAKFVPYGLTVTRAVDLTGKSGMNQSQAQLIGAVVVPPEFTPQKWSEPSLQEATDAKGNDLKPKPNAEGEMGGMNFEGNSFGQDSESDDEAATNAAADVRHVVTFSFHPPDWKVKEIGRVKGTVTLHYFSGAEVVKLTNAIPSTWLMNMAQAMAGGGGVDTAEKHLNSPRLGELGLAISMEEGMTQSGMTTLQLEIKGSKGALVDAQVFDADGKPWPTLMQMEGAGMGDSSSCQLMIAGSPKPPLSLAFLASGAGSSVEVPVMVEHVPLTAK
jgi:hypothetical protein